MSERIEKRFEKVFSQLGETNPIFTLQAKQQMFDMVEQITKANNAFTDISGTNQTTAVKAGFAAEVSHAESHNLDAILNGDSTRVLTDNDTEWYDNGFKKNDTPDLIAVKDGEVTHQSQAKYYKNSDSTAKAMRETKNGEAKYKDMDSLLGPSDQVNPDTDKASIRDQAHRTKLKESGPDGRKEVREAASQVEEKATDTVKTGESESTPLSKKEAEKLAKDHKKSEHKNGLENKYQTESTMQQMKKAAKGAATISAVMSGTYNTVIYCKMVKDGKMTEQEAVYKIISETASSAADSAVKASAVTGTQSLIVRYGSKELVEKLTEQSLKGMMRSNVATVGVICAIDAVKDLVKLGSGKITKDEFYERQGKNMLNTATGATGGAVGFSVGAATATSLGYTAGSTGLIVFGAVGGIAGGLIAGLAMQIAIENHIEQAYSDILRNTTNLNQSLAIFQNVSTNIFQGQVLFTEFLKEEERLDNSFAEKIEKIDLSGSKMSAAIDAI